MEEATDLAIVLRAGALPAPVEHPRGADGRARRSVRIRSTRATWQHHRGILSSSSSWCFYYRMSGMVADVALMMNIFLLLGVMVAFNATLTLPGIAGIVLTIGMAVDANVLIIERIREELRAGKTPRAAVEAGYAKAFLTILDSNVTTLVAALFLFVRHRAGQGIRRHADHRHRGQHVHRRLRHADHLRLLHLEPEDPEDQHLAGRSGRRAPGGNVAPCFEIIKTGHPFQFRQVDEARRHPLARPDPHRHRLPRSCHGGLNYGIDFVGGTI